MRFRAGPRVSLHSHPFQPQGSETRKPSAGREEQHSDRGLRHGVPAGGGQPAGDQLRVSGRPLLAKAGSARPPSPAPPPRAPLRHPTAWAAGRTHGPIPGGGFNLQSSEGVAGDPPFPDPHWALEGASRPGGCPPCAYGMECGPPALRTLSGGAGLGSRVHGLGPGLQSSLEWDRGSRLLGPSLPRAWGGGGTRPPWAHGGPTAAQWGIVPRRSVRGERGGTLCARCGRSWLGDSEWVRACALTAAFAFRSPHYACPEVIRVSSRRAPQPPVPACPRVSSRLLADPQPPAPSQTLRLGPSCPAETLGLRPPTAPPSAGGEVRRPQGGRVELRGDPVRAAGGEPPGPAPPLPHPALPPSSSGPAPLATPLLARPAPPAARHAPSRPAPPAVCHAPSRPGPPQSLRPAVTLSPAGRGRCPSTTTTCGSCWRR